MNAPGSKQTEKQRRAEARAAKVEAYRKEQQAQRRKGRIAWISGIAGGVAVLALVVTILVTATPQRERPQDIAIPGLKEFSSLPATHIDPAPVDYEAEYGMNPPAGGNHSQIWLNCGIYEAEQQNEYGVHALEHGAVWVTYDPELISGAQLDELKAALPDQYIILSPYSGLPAPIVASAWGAQIELDTASDERLGQFMDKYWRSASAPEPGASCSGAVEGPGRVA